jgi:hypothetical protein
LGVQISGHGENQGDNIFFGKPVSLQQLIVQRGNLGGNILFLVEALGGSPESEKFFFHYYILQVPFRGGNNKGNQEVHRDAEGAQEEVKPYPQGQAETGAADNQKNTEKNPPDRTNAQGQAQIPGEAQEEELGVIGEPLPGTGGVEKKGKKTEAEKKNDHHFGKRKKNRSIPWNFHAEFLRPPRFLTEFGLFQNPARLKRPPVVAFFSKLG